MRLTKYTSWLIIVALALALGGFWGSNIAQAIDIPAKPTSSIYCQDYADVLSVEARTQINNWGRQLNKTANGSQIVVITQATINGQIPAEYSLAILRNWGIGGREKNNGVVLLVVTNDKLMRIEVGRGLEGTLPDGKVGRIQSELMSPLIKQGDYQQAILNGYSELAKLTAAEYGAVFDPSLKISTSKATTNNNDYWSWWTELPWWAKIMAGAGIIVLLLIDWFLLGGFLTNIALMLLWRRGGNSGDNDSFGGGTGDGGGAERRW